MFDRLAEIAAEYLRKGSQVYIEGRIRTRKWQDKTDGKDRYTTEIIANEMQMLGSRGGAGAGAAQAWAAAHRHSQLRARARADAAGRAGGHGEFDDDIPF